MAGDSRKPRRGLPVRPARVVKGPLVAQVLAGGRASIHPLPPEGEVVVGRGRGAGLAVADRSVAGKHAVLFLGERVMIEDLGGGTTVDGRALRAGERALVLPGEPVDLGEALLVIAPAPGRPPDAMPVGPEELREVLARACEESEQDGGDVVVAHVRAEDAHDAATARAAVREALEPEDNLIADLDGSHWVVASAGPDGAAELLAGVRARLQDLRVKASVGLARYRALPDLDGLIRAARDELVPFEVPLRPGTIAASAPMRDVYRVAARLAAVEAPVLLLGEPGAGKGLVAKELHWLSPRREKPLVRAACSRLDADELEELFEEAAGGMLFLEDIGALSPPLQKHLAKALARKARPSERFRLVAATHRDLWDDPSFWRPLRDHLSAIALHVPPLRERRQEIEALAGAIAGGAPFTPAAMHQLLRYGWPGNVRELKLVIERALLDADGAAIDAANLGLEPVPMGAAIGTGAS